MSMPTIFVSHGSPTLILDDVPARAFLASLGQLLPKPKAIVAVSAHWDTDVPAVSLARKPETIHDFYGFPEALYLLRYAAPGAPGLAERAAPLRARRGLARGRRGPRAGRGGGPRAARSLAVSLGEPCRGRLRFWRGRGGMGGGVRQGAAFFLKTPPELAGLPPPPQVAPPAD